MASDRRVDLAMMADFCDTAVMEKSLRAAAAEPRSIGVFLPNWVGDVAMATPPHHAEPAAPPPPPVADTLVLRPGETLALPDSLMRRMRRGSVEVKVQVAPDGSVMDATIVQSSHPRLDQAALEAIKAAHFQPVSRPTSAATGL